jgi:seryl-tRNA synthetase
VRRRFLEQATGTDLSALDVEVYLEYRGPREKAEWLEITAATVHRDFYVNAFRIREVKSRRIWTGCVGHGITRWAAAFLARHGFDQGDWPKAIRSQLRYEPKPPRTVG